MIQTLRIPKTPGPVSAAAASLHARPRPAAATALLAAVLALGGNAAMAQGVTTATPQTEQTYVAAEHRDWQVLCTPVPDSEAELCEMYQLLTEESGQPVAEITIAALAETGDIVAGATITTPLETFLPTGLGFRIGRETEEMRIEPFRVCTAVGCVVRMGLTADEVTQMQRGAEAFVTIAPFVQIDQPLDLAVSLMGFTAALADVRERTPEPPEVTFDAPPAMEAPSLADPSQPPATPPAAQD